MTIRRLLPVAVALAFVALAAADVLACPNCKEAVASNSPGGAQTAIAGDAAAGFNHAIYFALASVFGIVGLLGFKVVTAVRRAERFDD